MLSANGAALVDVQKLPRLDGAKEDPARSKPDYLVYSVARPLADTDAALKQILAADGWKPYVAPLEETHATSLNFKKGPQGLSVSFTIQVGKNEQTSEETTVYYAPVRLNFALAIPDDAAGVAQFSAARHPLEQGYAELLFEQCDAPRDRRLRAMQHAGRVGDAAAAMHRQERVERVAVHVSAPCKKLISMQRITNLADG
jgi:hypothetical protein